MQKIIIEEGVVVLSFVGENPIEIQMTSEKLKEAIEQYIKLLPVSGSVKLKQS